VKHREVRKRLAKAGVEETNQGKGSHRTFKRGDDGYTVPYHGDNRDVPRPYLRDLQRIFEVDLGV
jgi:predicted RNA binding protein YcfA (HicA-like mRNA interferase family)